jgi:hypothetical protein
MGSLIINRLRSQPAPRTPRAPPDCDNSPSAVTCSRSQLFEALARDEIIVTSLLRVARPACLSGGVAPSLGWSFLARHSLSLLGQLGSMAAKTVGFHRGRAQRAIGTFNRRDFAKITAAGVSIKKPIKTKTRRSYTHVTSGCRRVLGLSTIGGTRCAGLTERDRFKSLKLFAPRGVRAEPGWCPPRLHHTTEACVI